MSRIGLVRNRHWLAYGWDHGFGTWLPEPVAAAIMSLWNHASCSLMGHDVLVQEEQDGRVACVSCLRSVPDPGKGVIRMWEMDR